jgi:hypothetical protein
MVAWEMLTVCIAGPASFAIVAVACAERQLERQAAAPLGGCAPIMTDLGSGHPITTIVLH